MKNHLLNYPTADELRALDLQARHARARTIARLFRTGALATVSLLDRLAGVPAEIDADTRKEFETPFWRAASKSLPAAWRRRYLAQMQSAERLELALDAVARVFRIGALATVRWLDRLTGAPAEKDADTRKEFATPFWRAASKSQPPAWRRRYLPQMKSAERLDLALDALARVWKSLAQLLHFSPRHPAH